VAVAALWHDAVAERRGRGGVEEGKGEEERGTMP